MKDITSIKMKNTIGRKTGSKNKLTKEAKEALYNLLESDYERINKLITPYSLEERTLNLKHFGKLLVAHNDDIADKTRELIFNGLEAHFKKLDSYFNHIPQEKKASELRQFIKLLGAEEIEKLLTNHTKSK